MDLPLAKNFLSWKIPAIRYFGHTVFTNHGTPTQWADTTIHGLQYRPHSCSPIGLGATVLNMLASKLHSNTLYKPHLCSPISLGSRVMNKYYVGILNMLGFKTSFFRNWPLIWTPAHLLHEKYNDHCNQFLSFLGNSVFCQPSKGYLSTLSFWISFPGHSKNWQFTQIVLRRLHTNVWSTTTPL